jgi:hypothetical protein
MNQNFYPDFHSIKTRDQDGSLIFVTSIVLFIHLLFVFWASWSGKQPHILPKKGVDRLVVKTISLKEPSKLMIETKPFIEPSIVPEPVIIQTPSLENAGKLPEVHKIEEKSLTEEKAKIEEMPKIPKTEEVKKPVNKPKAETTPKKTVPKQEVTKKAPTDVKKSDNKKVEHQPKTEKKPKSVEKQKEKPAIEATSKSVDNSRKVELLAKARNSIEKVQKASSTLASKEIAAVSTPGKINALSADTIALVEAGNALDGPELSYVEELASRLKLLLRLPEFGEVKIQLTLLRSGKFSNVSIVNSKSNKNKAYLEKTLPSLSYPPFGHNFSDKEKFTFTINLSNDL